MAGQQREHGAESSGNITARYTKVLDIWVNSFRLMCRLASLRMQGVCSRKTDQATRLSSLYCDALAVVALSCSYVHHQSPKREYLVCSHTTPALPAH